MIVAATALVFLPRLSDALGRRKVTLLALAACALGTLVLTAVDSLGVLLISRALQGLASGLATTAIAAYVVDLGSASSPRLTAAITGSGATSGLALGALLSGLLVRYAPAPTSLVYLLLVAALLLTAIAVALAPETKPTSGARVVTLLRPRIGVPVSARRTLPAAAVIFAMTWALGGLYQSLGPSLAASTFGQPGRLADALFVASLIGPTAIGGALADRVSGLAVAVVVFIVGVLGAVLMLIAGLFVPFLLVSVIAGIGFGLAYARALAELLHGIAQADRAGVLAIVYLTSNLGAAIPSLIAGQLSAPLGTRDVALGYGVGVLLAAGLALVLLAREPRAASATDTTSPPVSCDHVHPPER